MSNELMNRRSFLETSAMGAAVISSGMLFRASAKPGSKEIALKLFVCSVCGHIEFGEAPAFCPICHAPKESFSQNDSLFTEAKSKSPELAIGHIPEIFIAKSSKLITEEPVKEAIVRIGNKLHPMVEAHHIQWIDCYVDDHYVSRLLLTLGMAPAVGFYTGKSGSMVRIVEHCNLHGHWQAEAVL